MEDDLTVNPKFNVNVPLSITVKDEDKIRQLTDDLNAANETIDRVNASLQLAHDELSRLQEEYDADDSKHSNSV